MATQAALLVLKALTGSSQAGDQGQGDDEVKDKGNGKEAKSSSMAEDAAKANAKEVQAKTKKTDPQAKDTPALQSSQLEDPPKANST